MEPTLEYRIAELVAKEPAFTAEAYSFVTETVTYTAKQFREKAKREGREGTVPARRHLSALELLHGARDYAREEFGAVAGNVLREWGIVTARDFGRVVYLLIDAGVLAASPEDDPRDFEIDFDLTGSGNAGSAAPPPPRLLPFLDI